MGKLWKKNVVKTDIASYMHYIRGQKKVGKTTLFNDLVKYIGDGSMDKGLLISVGDEEGYKALDGLMVARAETWSDFVEIVDDLVDSPDDNDFKFIAIDTVDELVKLAIAEAKAIHKKRTGVNEDSLNKILGGYGAGRDKVIELVADAISQLKGIYGLFCIGHTKVRDIKEKGASEAYQQLTTSLNFDYDSVFADKADIIATISVDKSIVDVEEIEMSKGKTKKVGQLGGVTRWIHLRDDGYNVDCGSRFPFIVDKVELSAENYIHAIEGAIEKASGKSGKELEESAKIEEKERLDLAVERAKENSKVNVKKNLELVEVFKSQFIKVTDDNIKAEIKKVMTEYGITSLDVDVIETVKTEAFEKIVELSK